MLIEEVWEANKDGSCTPPSGGVWDMCCREEASGQTKDLMRDYVAWLTWIHLGVPLKELEKVAGD